MRTRELHFGGSSDYYKIATGIAGVDLQKWGNPDCLNVEETKEIIAFLQQYVDKHE